MLQIIKDNPKAAAAALLMHLVIILFLIVGVDWLETPKPAASNIEVVQARVVDQALVTEELEELKQAQTDQEAAVAAAREQEERRLEDLRSQQQQERNRLEELEQQRAAEEQRQAEVKAKRQAEEEKRKQAKAKQLAEQKKREAEKAEVAAEEKKRAEVEAKRKAAEESKRKAEQEQQRKAEEEKKRQAEAARKAEEEKKRKAEAARKAREAELEAAMEAEHNARVIDRYMLQIQQRVIGNWVRLDGTREDLKCRLRVRLAKGGTVLAVSIIESSGSGSFDRSAEAAVYKADPLPVPEDKLFEQFRDIIFVFDPNR